MAILADDFHLQAYQAWLTEGNTAGSTTTDNLPIAVCGNPPANTPRAGACASAAIYYTQYRGNVVAILNYGGAPYSTDDQWLLNGRGSLWVVNYNDFMETGGGYSSTCVKQTSGGTPCGAGVGEATLSKFYQLDSTTDEVSYGDYVTAWSVADQSDWTDLLRNWSSDHLVDYLSGLGFDKASLANRFFYTGDTIPGDFEVTKIFLNGNAHFHNLEFACFVSPESPHKYNGFVQAQPFCDKQTFVDLEYIDINHGNSGNKNACATFEVDQYLINDKEAETQTDALISNFMGGRYQMVEQCDSGKHVQGWEDPFSNQPPGQPPGWLLSYRSNMTNTDAWGPNDTGTVTSPVNSQYRWPVINLDAYYQSHDSTCTAQSTNRSDTGVLPSICGPLLDAYVNAYIPPAPTGAVPTLTVPEETLVVRVDQYEVPDGTYLNVRQPVNYASLVSAADPDRGVLQPHCFPPSDKALGLGITYVRCSATDLDGDGVQREFNVHVEYPFRFVDTLATQRGKAWLKAGRRIKIEFTTDGYKGLDVMTATPTSTRIDCRTGEITGKPREIRVDGRGFFGRRHDSQLRYNDAQDEYIQPWTTNGRWRNQCRRLSLPMVDDTVRTVDIRFY